MSATADRRYARDVNALQGENQRLRVVRDAAAAILRPARGDASWLHTAEWWPRAQRPYDHLTDPKAEPIPRLRVESERAPSDANATDQHRAIGPESTGGY